MTKRAVILIIDACGIGSMPDWAEYDEVAPSNTLGSVSKYAHENLGGLKIPNMQKMGIANIDNLPGLESTQEPTASFGKMAEYADAKDTITGHWEMVGIKSDKAFPYYPNGFPEEILEEFKKQTGVKGILCNATASGTTVINDLAEEHIKTGFPIIYTSADSVMQIAAHTDVIDLETQYKWCEIAREIMRGEHEVARIIARPFTTNPNYKDGDPNTNDLPANKRKYIRENDKRHDYSVLPPSKSVLDMTLEQKGSVLGVGKIQDIFAGVGVPHNVKTADNADGLEQTIRILKNEHPILENMEGDNQIIFINLVETDANFGHRRDPEGYARALEDIDKRIPEILENLNDDDILFITADHGCDPCAAGSDHTREYVPLLVYNPKLEGKNLETRESFADLGATILDWFEMKNEGLELAGKSCLN